MKTMLSLFLLTIFISPSTCFGQGQVNAMPDGSLISDMGTFPETEYQLASKDNVHFFAGVFVQPSQRFFGPDDQPSEKVSSAGRDGVHLCIDRVCMVRINNENGSVEMGEALTVSSVNGVAARALEGDPVVGVAVESYTGGADSMIMARVYYQPSK